MISKASFLYEKIKSIPRDTKKKKGEHLHMNFKRKHLKNVKKNANIKFHLQTAFFYKKKRAKIIQKLSGLLLCILQVSIKTPNKELN